MIDCELFLGRNPRCSQVCVQFVHLYSQKTSLIKTGGIWPGGYCLGGVCPGGNWPDTKKIILVHLFCDDENMKKHGDCGAYIRLTIVMFKIWGFYFFKQISNFRILHWLDLGWLTHAYYSRSIILRLHLDKIHKKLIFLENVPRATYSSILKVPGNPPFSFSKN